MLYEIPAGVGDDLFTVDPSRGIVTTRGNIDRESRAMFMIPIYVTEVTAINDFSNNFGFSKTNKNVAATASVAAAASGSTIFDVATIVIKINDVNDHAPAFQGNYLFCFFYSLLYLKVLQGNGNSYTEFI